MSVKLPWLVILAILPTFGFANDFSERKISDYVSSNTYVQSIPVNNPNLVKYFNCDFYHSTVQKSLGRTPDVAFYPDVIAIQKNGNVLTVSLPKKGGRLLELESCLIKRNSPSNKSQFQEMHDALNALYPFMNGPVENSVWYRVENKGVELVSANYFRGKNAFHILMKDGYPNQIHVKYQTGR